MKVPKLGKDILLTKLGELTSPGVSVVRNAAYHLSTFKNVAPVNSDLAAGQMVLWLDATPAATKLMVKCKDSAGTVKTGSITLT